MFREASYYSRMAVGLHKMARMPLAPDPRALVRRTLEKRETNFLELMRRAVYEYPANPYHQLFQWAGCTYGDLERAVRRDGLEPTLEKLRQEGVYLEHDEFKGKRPIRRGKKELAVDPGDFANPLVKGIIETSSSGSRSKGTVTQRSLEYQIYREAQELVLQSGFELSERSIVNCGAILPATGGLRRELNLTRRGFSTEKWFALGGTLRGSGHYRLLTTLLLLEARMLGIPVQFPVYLPHNDFSPVARWLAQRRSEGVKCLLNSSVSYGVRVAAAAAEIGLDISGTIFAVGGEALTDAKRAVIESTSCRTHALYGISELGPVGRACRQMHDGNRVHICLDTVAVISRRRTAPLTDVEIDSLMFTTLLPFAATVLVNIEMDDSGLLGPARCGCHLEAMGFTQQIDNIYSYGKLSGQGLTLVGGDMLNILEKSLPDRFGGNPTDYQLVECEGAIQTDIELRMHPRLAQASEGVVREFFLSEVKRLWGGALTRRVWEQTEGIRVVFAEPYLSGGRKIHALHLLGTTQQQRRR